jgi:dephospho-CoA kinase
MEYHDIPTYTEICNTSIFNMLKIGVTGGIGSGKTTVAKIFAVLGIPVFDADAATKKLMEEDVDLRASLIKAFGEKVYVDGKLDRKYLSNIVFNDGYKLELLNAITHPIAIANAQKWMEQQTAPYAIKEAALFFESGSAAGLDYIIGVSAPQHIRIKRVMDRSGLTREQVLLRMNQQLDEHLKMTLCDFVIVNDEQQMLIPQVLKLHEQFLTKTN